MRLSTLPPLPPPSHAPPPQKKPKQVAEQVCADVLERFGERRFDTEDVVRTLDGEIVRGAFFLGGGVWWMDAVDGVDGVDGRYKW